MSHANKNLRFFTLLTLFALILLLPRVFTLAPALSSDNGTIVATVTVNPLSIDVQARPVSPLVNKNFKIQAVVENVGSTMLDNAVATIFLPTGLTLLSNGEQFLGTIDGGRTKRASWYVQASEAGFYAVTVVVSAKFGGTDEVVQNEASTIIEVRSKPGKNISTFLDFLINIFR